MLLFYLKYLSSIVKNETKKTASNMIHMSYCLLFFKFNRIEDATIGLKGGSIYLFIYTSLVEEPVDAAAKQESVIANKVISCYKSCSFSTKCNLIFY